MPRDKADVIASLKKKGFKNSNSHHKYYTYHTLDGKVSSIYTYASHSSGKQIGDDLLSKMARQCKLKRADFLKFVDCSMSREDYEHEMKKNSSV